MRWKGIALAAMLCACPSAFGQTTIQADAYLDKLEGMWLGQVVGDYAGILWEGIAVSGGLSYQINWTDPTHIDPVSGQHDYVFRDNTWLAEDDTCFEYMNMNFMQTHPDPTPAQVGQLWAGSLTDPSFYIADHQARHLITLGVAPPASGSINWNLHWAMIDSQITTESLGAMAPGMVQRGVNLAGTFGSVTNTGYALHAAEYYAAMYSAAATESNMERLVAVGQSTVPTTSKTWQIIQDVRDWYAADKVDGNLDWRGTQALIWNKYITNSNNRYQGYPESSVNTALTTLAILYGGGDFQQTVDIGVLGGFNGDCNAGTAAGLVGLVKGFSGLSADIRARAGSNYTIPTYWMTVAPSEANLAQIAAGFQADAESQILLMGGSITGTGASRTYHIPTVPLTPLVEKPDPAGPKGLVGQLLALGGKVTVTASVAKYNANDDRTNLNGIISGITDVTYDGHLPYSTFNWTNHQPSGGDFYQLNFDRQLGFNSMIFYEGDIQMGHVNNYPDSNTDPSRGGWFTDLNVEVSNGGAFVPVTGLVLSEPLDPWKFYQIITLSFDPIEGNSIRIRGTAGGVDEFTTCLQLEAYGFVPGAAGNQWKLPAGNWSDANAWTGGVPGGGLGTVVVGNGGVVALSQPNAACDGLVLGQLQMESGLVNMTGGRLDSNWVAVGLRGAGTFTQSGGNHVIRQGLFIARDGNSAGTYALQDGNLCVSGGLYVGGSSSSSGGKGTLTLTGGVATVTGGLKIWSGGTVNLSGGALLAGGADANARVDVQNAGLLNVTAEIDTLGDLWGDGNDLTGSVTVGAGATLVVSSLRQDSVSVAGTLVLGGDDDYDAAGAAAAATGAPSPYRLALLARLAQLRQLDSAPSMPQGTPEPGTLILIVTGAAAMLGRRRAERSRVH